MKCRETSIEQSGRGGHKTVALLIHERFFKTASLTYFNVFQARAFPKPEQVERQGHKADFPCGLHVGIQESPWSSCDWSPTTNGRHGRWQ